MGFWSIVLGLSVLATAAQEARCPKPDSAKTLLKCILQNSPQAVRAELILEKARSDEEAAGKYANPSFSLQSGFLSASGPAASDHQLSLTQPIDLGGKRSSRVEKAQAQTAVQHSERKRIETELIIGTLLRLHRLRQLGIENRLIDETGVTLKKLIGLYKNRPSLTPEQQVSLSIFRSAEGDLELRKVSAEEEEKSYGVFFFLATGLSTKELDAAIPATFSTWPSLPKEPLPLLSPDIARGEAELKGALAELESARADSWPEIALGPYAQFQSDASSKSNLLGVALTMDLPVLSLNRSGRVAAEKGTALAEKSLEMTKREQGAELERLREVYMSSIRALSKFPSLEEQEKTHVRLERLFVRGVVPSALVIESHRQLLDLVRSRHERENRAMEAWWRIKSLQGKISEEAQ